MDSSDSWQIPPPLYTQRMESLKMCAECGLTKAQLLCCSVCKITFYCDKACQSLHWKAGHKQGCTPPEKAPAELFETQNKNTTLADTETTETAHPGTDASTTKSDSGESKSCCAPSTTLECANCCAPEGNGVSLSPCARCRLVYYCGKDCQSQHWKNKEGGHKNFCITVGSRKPVQLPPRTMEDNECAICVLSISLATARTLPCAHTFHGECVEGLRKFGVLQVCPKCRAALPARNSEKLFDKGVKQDDSDSEGFKWFLKAALGDANAQCNLGCMYSRGLHVKQSYSEAFNWYLKAAEQGNANAQVELGGMYFKGQLVKQSDSEAVKWCLKAAEQGNAKAQCALGDMYFKGKGVKQSDSEAVRCLTYNEYII